jgi:hypothetical protein
MVSTHWKARIGPLALADLGPDSLTLGEISQQVESSLGAEVSKMERDRRPGSPLSGAKVVKLVEEVANPGSVAGCAALLPPLGRVARPGNPE